MNHIMKCAFFGFCLLASVAFADAGSLSQDAREKPIVGSILGKNLPQPDYSKADLFDPREASEIALTAVPGKILSVGLEKEDGYLVYAVNVIASSAEIYEINVDAGNGKILSKELKNDENSNEKEDNETEEEND